MATVNGTIQEALLSSGLKVTQQKEIDDLLIKLDGTKDKTKLGANAIVGVSMAVAVAGAAEAGIPLYEHIANLAGMGNAPFVIPCPSFNVINGGQHAGNQLAFQEFMIVPVGASSFEEAMKMATETYHALKNVIKQRYGMDGKITFVYHLKENQSDPTLSSHKCRRRRRLRTQSHHSRRSPRPLS